MGGSGSKEAKRANAREAETRQKMFEREREHNEQRDRVQRHNIQMNEQRERADQDAREQARQADARNAERQRQQLELQQKQHQEQLTLEKAANAKQVEQMHQYHVKQLERKDLDIDNLNRMHEQQVEKITAKNNEEIRELENKKRKIEEQLEEEQKQGHKAEQLKQLTIGNRDHLSAKTERLKLQLSHVTAAIEFAQQNKTEQLDKMQNTHLKMIDMVQTQQDRRMYFSLGSVSSLMVILAVIWKVIYEQRDLIQGAAFLVTVVGVWMWLNRYMQKQDERLEAIVNKSMDQTHKTAQREVGSYDAKSIGEAESGANKGVEAVNAAFLQGALEDQQKEALEYKPSDNAETGASDIKAEADADGQ